RPVRRASSRQPGVDAISFPRSSGLIICSVMVESTFQLTRGVGPLRERRLWDAGVAHWRDFRAVKRSDEPIARAIDDARDALAVRDAARLAARVPSREHWRLFATFEE